ncbi:MAG: MBL fold metallo-hydrolase [Clostridiales Family XIII bacterium]|jgi:glyoxylase-like metal-dependent hydrolase (beta-lactamase superfamily II)|nr:MBL fold metallo-hydrolase [Clostridiales Family XIII bacterium]
MKILAFVLGMVGTNCYLVWNEETQAAMLIDPAVYDDRIERELTGRGLKLKYIVLTHGHGDHIGGVPHFLALHPSAELAAGAGESAMLADARANLSREIFGEELSIKPDVPLRDGDELRLGELVFHVMETPGHTPGGISLYAADRDPELAGGAFDGTVFTGDTLFQGSVGRTDLPGGDFETLARSIRTKLYPLPENTLALPGHMGGTTIGAEKQGNPFVHG